MFIVRYEETARRRRLSDPCRRGRSSTTSFVILPKHHRNRTKKPRINTNGHECPSGGSYSCLFVSIRGYPLPTSGQQAYAVKALGDSWRRGIGIAERDLK